MHDLPRQKLRELIIEYGRSLCDDPRRCEALLKDYCGQYKREIFVLISALKNRVAEDLINASAGVPQPMVVARLNKRLEDELAMTTEAAHWAVESWALALNVIDQPISMIKSVSVSSFSPPTAQSITPNLYCPPESLLIDRYQDNGDGTIVDIQTRLHWMRFSLGQKWTTTACVNEAKMYNWEQALKLVQAVNQRGGYASFCDWRVPTKEELLTLVYCTSGRPKTWNNTGHPCQGNYDRPTIHQPAFPNTPSSWYWSSSHYDLTSAWCVHFYYGHAYADSKQYAYYVRLVRGRK